MARSEAAMGITRPAAVCVVMSDTRFEIAYFPCSMEGTHSWADCNQADWWPRPTPPDGVVVGLMAPCSALQTFLPHHVPLEIPPTQQKSPHPTIPSTGLRPGPQPGPTARRSHPGKRLGRGPGAPGQPPRAHRRHSSPQILFLPLATALLQAQPKPQVQVCLLATLKRCIPLCCCDGFVSKTECWRVVEVSIYQNRS